MKKISLIVFIGLAVLATSCKKYLDINKNPNSAISATPELILPQALAGTANTLNGYNNYGAQLGGYMANAGGYGGFGTSLTYNFSSGDHAARWENTYDNLEDYQAILNTTDENPEYLNFNAVARIMKSFNFQLLVDTYNDVPYSEALRGAENLTPKYDEAGAIYKDLADQLDIAIAAIHEGETTPGLKPLGQSDVMFDGDMERWLQFANTLKLRLIIRAEGKVDFANKAFDDAGFLEEDAMVNPGYTRDRNRQNPKWNTWGWGYDGTEGNKAWMPNTFVMTFYDGSKLSDEGRGSAIFYSWPSTPTNRLGIESDNVQKSPSGSFWYNGDDRGGTTAGGTTGVLKGPDASMPVITAAESYFLQAEGAIRGFVTGDPKTLFENGIKASFDYLYQLPDGSYPSGMNPVVDAQEYIAENNSSYLVNFDLAASTDQKIEAIITQKYIALNMVNSQEGWNEYRRTGYPKLVNTAGATGKQTFASFTSESTRPDKLPARILYPSTEGSYNSTNVPKNISPFTSTIFWAQ